jgi:hypothetical protein
MEDYECRVDTVITIRARDRNEAATIADIVKSEIMNAVSGRPLAPFTMITCVEKPRLSERLKMKNTVEDCDSHDCDLCASEYNADICEPNHCIGCLHSTEGGNECHFYSIHD